ncbi:uncharacterized protein LOC128216733 [Mya arenaria]|uniref:uncharacterized protein LOC128216733 n=1 Tax=Mya arenaria TaxID=6604 RepID=UPI0022E2DB7E|nr:uncharacterized protein LOC128216733 [Mya arenaria]
MFEDDFKEKKDKNVNIKDIKRADFMQFLYVCDPMVIEHPTDQNVFQVVEIAEKYQHESMIKKCRSIMSENILRSYNVKANEAIDVLSLAEKYGYKELLQEAEGCLLECEFNYLLNTEHFEKLPLDFKYQILSKRVLKYNKERVSKPSFSSKMV